MRIIDEATVQRFRRVRRGVIAAALAIAVAAPLCVLAGALGARSGLWSLHLGFDWLTIRIAPTLALVGLALGVLAALAVVIAPPRRGLVPALLAAAIGGVSSAELTGERLAIARAPPVHDVDTDWTQALMFSPRMMVARGPAANPVESNPVVQASPFAGALAGQYVAVVNARTCPAATPLTLAVPPDRAFARVLKAVRDDGLALVDQDPAAGLVEATGTSLWFGFKEDLAARVRASCAGARIDLRASNRTGDSDFGRGCRLVTRLRRRLAG